MGVVVSGLTKSIRRIRGAGAVTLLGLAVSASLPASAKEAEDVSAAGAAKQSLAIVRTAKAERSTISADLVFTGDIQAQSQVNVAFRNNGKIATRLVEVGDHVTADQVLAKLDPQEAARQPQQRAGRADLRRGAADPGKGQFLSARRCCSPADTPHGRAMTMPSSNSARPQGLGRVRQGGTGHGPGTVLLH